MDESNYVLIKFFTTVYNLPLGTEGLKVQKQNPQNLYLLPTLFTLHLYCNVISIFGKAIPIYLNNIHNKQM